MGYEELEREVCDWSRFKNRKALGSYTGLVGGVHASDDNIHDLPITKAGNVRLRTMLIELAWRWVFHQRQTPLIQRWSVLLTELPIGGCARRPSSPWPGNSSSSFGAGRPGVPLPEQFGWIMLHAKA